MISDFGEGVAHTKRRFIVMMGLIYSVASVVAGAFVAVALINIFNGNAGYLVMLVVFGFIGALTGYWMIAYLRDMGAEPIAVEGEIMRKWIRGRLLELFFPSCYITVAGKIFIVQRLDYASLLETDLVRVRCYPHSLTVEAIERYDETRKRFVPAHDGATA